MCYTRSCFLWFTWFLYNSIAGVCYLLPFGLIWVLVVVEVAINRRVTLIKLISLHKDDVNKPGVTAVSYVYGTTKPILRLYELQALCIGVLLDRQAVSSTPCGNKGEVMKQTPIYHL